jgi:hypothetical protein
VFYGGILACFFAVLERARLDLTPFCVVIYREVTAKSKIVEVPVAFEAYESLNKLVERKCV